MEKIWLCGLRLNALCLWRSHLRCGLGSWCTGEICINLVIPAGGTDYYLTLILQRPVQRKRDLDFLFFPPVCIFFGVTAHVVYPDDVRIQEWIFFCASSTVLVAINTLTDCFCGTILSLHPFQRRTADWTKPLTNPKCSGAYERCIIATISGYPPWLSGSNSLHPHSYIIPLESLTRIESYFSIYIILSLSLQIQKWERVAV